MSVGLTFKLKSAQREGVLIKTEKTRESGDRRGLLLHMRLFGGFGSMLGGVKINEGVGLQLTGL